MAASHVRRMGFLTSLLLSAVPAFAQDAVRVPVDTQGVTLEVTELRVTDDGYLTMRGRLRNESGSSASIYTLSGSHLDSIALLDMTNRRKHLVVRDSNGYCLCGGNDNVGNGEARQIWAKFAPPPETVTKMSVAFGRIEPIAVPVSR